MLRQNKNYLFLITLFFEIIVYGMNSYVFASSSIILEEGKNQYPLVKYLEILEDKKSEWTIESIISSESSHNFLHNTKDTLNLGFTRSTIWTKFRIQNNSPTTQEWFLELDNPRMQYVDLYIIDSTGKMIVKKKQGMAHPFNQRDLNYRNNVFKILISYNNQYTIYLRTQTETSHSLNLTIWSPIGLAEKVSFEQYFLGSFYGIAVVMAVYNLFLLFFTKDKSYFFYIVYISSLTINQAGIDGFTSQYLWQNSSWWALRSVLFFAGTAYLGAVGFMQSFLKLRDFYPKINTFFWGIQGIILLLILTIFIGNYLIVMQIFNLLAIIPLIILIIGIISWKNGFRPARLYVLGWSIFLISVVIVTSQLIGWIPKTFFLNNMMKIGAAFEFVILSIALSDRINAIRRERDLFQKKTLISQRILNEELDAQVKLRTAELLKLNIQLEGLANTDSLTGLFNRRHFFELVNPVLSLLTRKKNTSSLLMMDIDKFKNINDTFGHDTGDQVLKSFAKIILRIIRKSDICARYGGEEFLVFLPNTSIENALVLAEKLRRAIENYKGIQNIKFTVSIGVTSFLDEHIENAIKIADTALYSAKNNGRNKVEYCTHKNEHVNANP